MRKPSWFQRISAVFMIAGVCAALGPVAGASAQEPKLPVVFVHGGSGSASQYEVQAQRWASNAYPYEVKAIDRAAGVNFNTAFDEFVDDVLAETGEDQIYMVAHSIGVPIASGYLNSSPERAARVAKYIGIDGAGSTPDSCPGGVDENGDWNVPCAGVFGRGNPNRGFGPDHNVHFPNQGHTEVVGSPESFEAQYEWFTGEEPQTADVLPEAPGDVTIAGRALSFPANTPLVGSAVQLFEVHGSTGVRKDSQPKASFTIDQTGDFGPVEVNGQGHYEMTLTGTDGFTQHFYFEPFVRDNHLLRLLQSPSNSALAQAIDRSPNHSTVVIERQKEFWGDNPLEGTVDSVEVGTTRRNAPGQPPLEVINPQTAAFTENFVLALVTWDEGSDGISDTSGQLPVATFLSTIDVFYPAATPSDGTITVDMLTRGESKRQVLNAPNWASTEHGVTFKFRNWVQDFDTWAQCKRLKPSPCK